MRGLLDEMIEREINARVAAALYAYKMLLDMYGVAEAERFRADPTAHTVKAPVEQFIKHKRSNGDKVPA